MSSSKQPNPLRMRISPPGKPLPRVPGRRSPTSRTPSSSSSTSSTPRGVAKKGKPTARSVSRTTNPLKHNALFQAIQGIPRTSPPASAPPAASRPGQELRDRIAGKKPKPVVQTTQRETPDTYQDSSLSARFGKTPAKRSSVPYSNPSAYSTTAAGSSYNAYQGPRYYPSSSSRPSSANKPVLSGLTGTPSSTNHRPYRPNKYHGSSPWDNDKYSSGRDDKYDRNNREKYDRTERTVADRTSDRYDRSDRKDRSDRNERSDRSDRSDRYDRPSTSDNNTSRYNSRSQSYQESRERYAEDRVRSNAAPKQEPTTATISAPVTEAGSQAAPYTIPDGPVVTTRPATAAPATVGTTLSANGAPTYSIKHLAMPPIVQISNLDRGTTRDDLYKFFVELGEILDCRVLTLGNQGAMGEITFADPDAAKTALAKFNGALADGRRLVVNIVKYNSIADQKPIEVSNTVHQWPGAIPLRSDNFLRK